VQDKPTYAAVTVAYWGFTLTDGALRMLVLLHFHALGFSPLNLALLFLLYEAMGILTNFFGGWIGARFGLRLTLFAGLGIQILALMLLSFNDPAWVLAVSVAYVMGAQALSGIAKDLTKMSSKSAVKLVVSDANGALFRWVAALTGSKNALKGIGFFLGGALLQGMGFQGALWLMAGALAVVLLASLIGIRSDLGKTKTVITRGDLFSKTPAINWLSFARVFLFASRDVWFVVGLPIFLSGVLGWSYHQVGAFMALWIIGYGIVQGIVPHITRSARDPQSATRAARLWGFVLAALPLVLGLALTQQWSDPGTVLISGLLVFGVIFAINSALHSYLIVAFADDDKVSLAVGFYYMANAVGRFLGTLLSGLVYQLAGLEACLYVSGGMVLIAALSVCMISPSPEKQTPAP